MDTNLTTLLDTNGLFTTRAKTSSKLYTGFFFVKSFMVWQCGDYLWIMLGGLY